MRHNGLRLTVGVLSALLFGGGTAHAQLVINAGEDVRLQLGVLGQFWADSLNNPEPAPTTNNLFIRRLRLLFGGQVAKNVTFFVETDAPNLGRTLPTGKNIQPSVIVQDAYAELRVSDAFAIDAGLMFIPFSRNALQSAATLLPIDYGAYTFSDSAPEQSSTGRDTGFQAKGYLLQNHLEYRVGAFQGQRNAESSNAFRYAARAQYNVLETEAGFFYTGTYLGRRRILAFGGGIDAQADFRAYAADVFLDHPLGPGAVTAQVAYNRFDGGDTLASLLKQDDVLVEAGYFVRRLKLTPVLQFARRDIAGMALGDETRTSIGANYWWAGHNANIKAAYTRIAPRTLGTQHEFTVQVQIFYF